MSVLRWCLRGHRAALLLAAGLGVLAQGLLVAMPVAVQRALDDGIRPGSAGATAGWAAALVGLGLAAALAETAGQKVNYLAGARIVQSVRERLGRHVLRLDRAAAARFGHGDLISRAGRDAEQLWVWVGDLVDTAHLVVGGLLVLTAIALLDPMLALAGLAVVPIVALLGVMFRRRYETASARLGEVHGERGDAVHALVAGASTVRGIGGERVLLARHHERSAAVSRETGRVTGISAWWASSTATVPLLGAGAGLIVAGPAAVDGRLSTGSLVAFVAWMSMLAQYATGLSDQQAQRRAAHAAAQRIDEVLSLPIRPDGPSAPRPLPPRGVLRSGEVSVLPGRMLLVSGPTGSGKTTLLRTLAGLDPGDAEFGGVPLGEAAPAEVRARISYVPQRPVLISGTIADNLTLGGTPATTADLEAACRAADVLDEIHRLPDGFGTIVGEGGSTLSGGQIQRLAIAWGLLRRPAVLILDGALSAVDSETSRTILARLRDLDPELSVVLSGTGATADDILDLPERTRV